MLNTIIRYTFWGALAFMALTHASEAGTLVKNGANGFTTVDHSLQGR